MPIDPSIPLRAGQGVTPMRDPLETVTAFSELQNRRRLTEAQEQDRALQLQQHEMQVAAARQAAQEKARIEAVYAKHQVTDPATGLKSIDWAGLVNDMPAAGLPGALQLWQQADTHSQNAVKFKRETREWEDKAIASAAEALVQSKYDPGMWQVALRGLHDRGQLEPASYARLSAITDPAQIQSITDGAFKQFGKKPELTNVPKGGTTINELGKVIFQDTRVDKPNMQQKTVMLDGKPGALVNYDPESGKSFLPDGTDVSARIKDNPPSVDPSLAASRDIANQLARMALASGGLTPNQRASEINTLRNSWTRNIQPVLDRRGAVAKIDTGLTALTTGNRNAATQIIVTAFNKLQDETSVVREGEYARSEQGQAVMARIQGALTRMSEGGANLTDADLRALAAEAKNVATALEGVSGSALSDTREAIEKTLDDYQIPHDRVFGSSTIGQRKAAPKVGEIVNHPQYGRVRVTSITNGQIQGEPVP